VVDDFIANFQDSGSGGSRNTAAASSDGGSNGSKSSHNLKPDFGPPHKL